jgi:hypothetical protein
MKIPSIFKCCHVQQTDGVTSIKIKSSCFDKPININIGSDVNANELIIDFIKKLSAKPKKEPQTEQLNSDLEVSLNEV